MKSQEKTNPKAKVEVPVKSRERYFEATGGRKTASARVRLFTVGSGMTVNDKEYTQYFKAPRNQTVASAPLELLKMASRLRVSAKVFGGGINAQAEAVRNGIAKALVKLNPDFKKQLRKSGFITRDARMVERKKYGLKKARRAPQWQKR